MPVAPKPLRPQTGIGWLDAVVNSFADDPMGGLSPQPMGGVVMNAGHPVAQVLKRTFPKVYNALERIPNAVWFSRLAGEGPSVPMTDGRTVRGLTTVKNTGAPGYSRYVDEATQGHPAFVMQFPERTAEASTVVHEPLHVLYGAKNNPVLNGDMLPPEAATAMLNRGPLSDRVVVQNSPTHSALHRMAENITERGGYAPDTLLNLAGTETPALNRGPAAAVGAVADAAATNPARLTAGQLNKALATAKAEADKVLGALPDWNPGQGLADRLKVGDPPAQAYQAAQAKVNALRDEMTARYGSGHGDVLPTHKRGAFGPRATE
jgi:hypothetical protein